MKLVFATNNSKKILEARDILPEKFQLRTLEEIDFHQEIIEDSDTFTGNAWIKANTIFKLKGEACFADDSGLVVPALGGLPGVKSARYANETGIVDHKANNIKLLEAMREEKNRDAYFITVICLILSNGEVHYFEGRVNGFIADREYGDKGFGYDPIFIPENYTNTFGELGSEIKNAISHRARALHAMHNFLITLP
jgi:XTP/dITP diphosphohydrolase